MCWVPGVLCALAALVGCCFRRCCCPFMAGRRHCLAQCSPGGVCSALPAPELAPSSQLSAAPLRPPPCSHAPAAGQALCALGRHDAAVDDLRQAVRLSPETEKARRQGEGRLFGIPALLLPAKPRSTCCSKKTGILINRLFFFDSFLGRTTFGRSWLRPSRSSGRRSRVRRVPAGAGRVGEGRRMQEGAAGQAVVLALQLCSMAQVVAALQAEVRSLLAPLPEVLFSILLHPPAAGVVIEEVTEPAAADEQPPAPVPAAPAAAAAAAEQREGLAESDTDEDMPPLEELAPAAPAAPAVPPGGFGLPGGVAPGMDAQRMQQAQEMFKASWRAGTPLLLLGWGMHLQARGAPPLPAAGCPGWAAMTRSPCRMPMPALLQSNPDMARQAASAMAAMSDDQLAAMLAHSGMPGVTPDMAKQAAAMMRSMPPDQLAAMAQAQAAAGFPGAPAGAPPVPAAPAPAAAAATEAAAAAGGGGDQMAAATEAMRQNPEMLKQARLNRRSVAACQTAAGCSWASKHLGCGTDWSSWLGASSCWLPGPPMPCCTHSPQAHSLARPLPMRAQAAAMMEAMSEEQLRSMAAMMPGGAAVSPTAGCARGLGWGLLARQRERLLVGA